MSGPTPFDYFAAFLCFAIAGACLVGVLAAGWQERRHYRRPQLTRRQRRAWQRGR